MECKVLKAVNYHNMEYLIVLDSVLKKTVLTYRAVHSLDGFEIEGIDERTESMILKLG